MNIAEIYNAATYLVGSLSNFFMLDDSDVTPLFGEVLNFPGITDIFISAAHLIAGSGSES